MTPDEMKQRTRALGLRVIRLVESLPSTRTADVIGKQLLRCGTSVGANYRAACRARSRPDFTAKMGIVEEEADEILYWIEMLIDCGLVKQNRVKSLLEETNEIVSMVVSSIRTARANGNRRGSNKSAIRIPQSAI
ncbi:MAG: four helix bundle protein [Pyrinomonadaceae bacterium]